VEESPRKDDFAVDVQTDVHHSTLTNEAFVIMSELRDRQGKRGNVVELSLNCVLKRKSINLSRISPGWE